MDPNVLNAFEDELEKIASSLADALIVGGGLGAGYLGYRKIKKHMQQPHMRAYRAAKHMDKARIQAAKAQLISQKYRLKGLKKSHGAYAKHVKHIAKHHHLHDLRKKSLERLEKR
jgi:hypothetical protein